MLNNFIQNTKQFFNKKPVRIILAILIIASIMTGVAFGIIAIVRSLNPQSKCPKGQTFDENYNTCLENACANKEDDYCNSQLGGNIEGGILNTSNFPSCGTCICPDDKILNSTQTKCIDKCGNTGKGCEDGNICGFLNNTSTDVTSSNLECFNPDSYSKCENQINNYDIYCSNIFTCKNTSDNRSYCDTNTPAPSPSHQSCDENSGYPCQNDPDCNSQGTTYKCKKDFYDENDWRYGNIGICDKNSTINRYEFNDCLSIEDAKKSLTLDKDNRPTKCSTSQHPCDHKANPTLGNSCITGCCSSSVCEHTGYCPKTDYKCLKNGDVCKTTNVYNDDKSCCDSEAPDGQNCLHICNNSPFNGPANMKCTTQDDCDKIYNDDNGANYLGKIYPQNDFDKNPQIKALCVKDNPDNSTGICKLACGNEDNSVPKKEAYSCGNLQSLSFCSRKGLCGFGTPIVDKPAIGSFDYQGTPYNKNICYENGTKKPYWKPANDSTQYNRTLTQPLQKSDWVNSEFICSNIEIFNSQMEIEKQYNYANITDSTYCHGKGPISKQCPEQYEYDYLHLTQNCNNLKDIGPIYPPNTNNKLENFENIELADDQTTLYNWKDGNVLQPDQIANKWNVNGYYESTDNVKKCVNGKNVTNNCKYLSNSLYCNNGSFDGSTCLNFDPTAIPNYSINNLCYINPIPSTQGTSQYGNNFICTMPSGDEQQKQYKCSKDSSETNGFGLGSCCGIGYISEKENKPYCNCGNNVYNASDQRSSCTNIKSANFLQANNFKWRPLPFDRFYDNNEGNKIKIIGESTNYYPTKSIKGDYINKKPAKNYLIILQYITEQGNGLYLNIDNVVDNSKLKLTAGNNNLNIFWRQAPDNVWSQYSYAGNIYTCLTYYDTSAKHYYKLLNGVNDIPNVDKYAIVSKSNQMVPGNNIKPIIIIDLGAGDDGNNEYVLGATYINFNDVGNPSVYINADSERGRLYIASINSHTNEVEFNNYVDTGKDDSNLVNNIRNIQNLAKFKCNLILEEGGKDDSFLTQSGSTINTIKKLIDNQFNITQGSNPKTINQLLSMFNHVYNS